MEDDRERALFLFYTTSGLRKHEIRDLLRTDFDVKTRIVIPRGHNFGDKRITLINKEAKKVLLKYLGDRTDSSLKLFCIGTEKFKKIWKRTYDKTGIKITPQTLREWFCSQMGELGVPDRYVDAFCGRIPKSVLARHYSDFSETKLKRIYDKANLRILG